MAKSNPAENIVKPKRKRRAPLGPIQPGQRLLFKAQVLELLDVAYTALFSWMRQGKFPLPIELGPPGGKSTKLAWLADEVDEWIAARPRRKFTPVPTIKDDDRKPARAAR